MTKAEKIEQINAAIGQVSRALKRAVTIGVQTGNPIQAVTFKVLRNGDTRMHIDYRKP